MLTATPMRHVTLYVLGDQLDQVSHLLAESGMLEPIQSRQDGFGNDGVEDVGDIREILEYFHVISKQYQKLSDFLGFERRVTEDNRQWRLSDIKELETRLSSINDASEECEQRLHKLQKKQARLDQQLASLEMFSRLDVHLGRLRQSHDFLDVRVGTLGRPQLSRVKDALGIVGYTLQTSDTDDAVLQVVITGLKGNETEVTNVLKAAGFHALNVPEEFDEHPDTLALRLHGRRGTLTAEASAIEACVEQLRKDASEVMAMTGSMLQSISPLVQLASSVHTRGQLVSVEGWVPANKIEQLKQSLDQFSIACLLKSRKPQATEYARVPTLVPEKGWLASFSALVRNYGVPGYREIDPTLLFAMSFIVMFGMMFGDVGHGFVILAGGLLFKHKLRRFTTFFILAGASSMFFGVLYGSVFGYEDMITHLWLSPLHEPMRLLLIALYWGVGFIIIATLISAWNLWASGHRDQALMGARGLGGLAFYLGAILFFYTLISKGSVSLQYYLLVLIPFATLLFHSWKHTESRGAERWLVTFMDGYEGIMSYTSNTLSFLRVAAFGLNHAALALAIITLANLGDGVSHWVSLVVGNAVIVLLEGGIVLIQVLRLEYYEGFARFFHGDGHAYAPLRFGWNVS
ncbi:MAG: V-type ATP synthase subunit I [bacterium]